MAILYYQDRFTLVVNGTTLIIGPMSTLDKFDLPDPPVTRTHKIRVNGECGSGPYLISKFEPIYNFNEVAKVRTSRGNHMYAGRAYALYQGWVGGYDWHYYAEVINDLQGMYVNFKTKPLAFGHCSLETMEVFTYKGDSNLGPSTGAHIIVQDRFGYELDWNTLEGFEPVLRRAIKLVLGAVSDPYNVRSSITGQLSTGQRFTALPYGASSYKASTYYGTDIPKVTYEDDSRDSYTFSKLINVGIWDSSIKQVCAAAYLDAFEQLPNVSSNGIANIMEAANVAGDLLSGVSSTIVYGMDVMGSRLLEIAENGTDPRNDWLTWRYVYNTTKMDVKEMSDVIGRCRDLHHAVMNYGVTTLTCEGYSRDGDYSAIDHVRFNIADTVKPGTMNYAGKLNESHAAWATRVSECPAERYRVQQYLMPEIYGYPDRDTEKIDPEDLYTGTLEGSMSRILPSSALTLDDVSYMYRNKLFPIQWKGAATMDWLKSDTLDDVLDSLDARLTAANAWDLIPFSFVADWFLNIGNFISTTEAWNEARHVMPVEEWMTIVHTRLHGYTFMRVNAGHPSLPPITKRTKVNDKTIAYRAADTISLFT